MLQIKYQVNYWLSIRNLKTHFWICPNLNGVVRQRLIYILSMCKCIGPNYVLLNLGVHFFGNVSGFWLKSSPNFDESWNDVQSKLQRKHKVIHIKLYKKCALTLAFKIDCYALAYFDLNKIEGTQILKLAMIKRL